MSHAVKVMHYLSLHLLLRWLGICRHMLHVDDICRHRYFMFTSNICRLMSTYVDICDLPFPTVWEGVPKARLHVEGPWNSSPVWYIISDYNLHGRSVGNCFSWTLGFLKMKVKEKKSLFFLKGDRIALSNCFCCSNAALADCWALRTSSPCLTRSFSSATCCLRSSGWAGVEKENWSQQSWMR